MFTTCAHTVLSASYLLTHLFLTSTLLGSYYCYMQFAYRVDKDTESLNNFPRIVHPIIGRAGIWTQALWVQSPVKSSLNTKLRHLVDLLEGLSEKTVEKHLAQVCSRASKMICSLSSPPCFPSSAVLTLSNLISHYSFSQNPLLQSGWSLH